MEQENKLQISRRFFKVLIPGFHNKLNLPPSFSKKVKQEKIEWAMLTSRKGTFKIKVCKNSEGVISFEDGWPKFVESHSLSIADFVVFEHVDRLNFNVFVFGPSGCEKEFLNESNENGDDEEVNPSRPKMNKRKAKEECVISYDNRNVHFIKTMTNFHSMKNAEVVIPIELVRLNNFDKKEIATLRDGDGRLWTVTLKVRRFSQLRVHMYKGWHDFYVANKLKVGDVCVFNLNPGPPTSKTIFFDVKIIRPSV